MTGTSQDTARDAPENDARRGRQPRRTRPGCPASRHLPSLLAPHPRFPWAHGVESAAHGRRSRDQYSEHLSVQGPRRRRAHPPRLLAVPAGRRGSTSASRSPGACCRSSTTTCAPGSGSGSSSACGRACSPTCTGMSLGFFERRQLGDLMSRLAGDVNAIEQLVLSGVMQVVAPRPQDPALRRPAVLPELEARARLADRRAAVRAGVALLLHAHQGGRRGRSAAAPARSRPSPRRA